MHSRFVIALLTAAVAAVTASSPAQYTTVYYPQTNQYAPGYEPVEQQAPVMAPARTPKRSSGPVGRFFRGFFGGGDDSQQAPQSYSSNQFSGYQRPIQSSDYDPSWYAEGQRQGTPGYTEACNDYAEQRLEEAKTADYGPQVSSTTPIELYIDLQYGRFGPYTFPLLGGRPGQPTPKGNFTVKAKKIDQYSNKYDSPMPLAVFFTDQCAIHVGSLTDPSRGCVHVDWDTAVMLYRFAKPGVTKVIVRN